jgi:protein CpxP
MMSPDDQLKRLTKELDLTADQQSKIKPILVDTQKKIEDVRDNSSGDRQAMREKLMQIRQDNNTQIKALLNDSQKDKFDKIQEQREDRAGGNRRGGPGGPGGAGGDNSGSGGGSSGGNTPAPQN